MELSKTVCNELRFLLHRKRICFLVDLKKPSSKRPYAFIRYENLDMAYEARRAMNGHLIGKSECKIGYGV